MRKGLIVLTALMVLCTFTIASAYDFEGKIGVGAFFDYGFGFGDNFDEVDFGTFTGETKIGFSFGGQFMYGITSNIAIAALVDYQQITFSYDGESAPEDPDAENFIIINANGMYFFGGESEMVPFVELGGGYYMYSEEDSDDHFGLNGGIGMMYFFQENMAFELGGRFHMLFDSDDELDTSNTTYLDFRVGIKYFLGGYE